MFFFCLLFLIISKLPSSTHSLYVYYFYTGTGAEIEDHDIKSRGSLRCEECFSVISKGKPHTCNDMARVKNVEELINKSSEKAKNQIISSSLKHKSCIENEKRLCINQLRGKPLNLIVNPNSPKPATGSKTMLTAKDMTNIRTKYGLSQKVTRNMATDLRIATKNRKFVEPNLKKSLVDNNHLLDSFFVVKSYNFKKSVKVEIDKETESSKVKKTENVSLKLLKSEPDDTKIQKANSSKKSIKSKTKRSSVTSKNVKKEKRSRNLIKPEIKERTKTSKVVKTEKIEENISKKVTQSNNKRKYEMIEAEHTAVICRDLPGLIKSVKEKRNLENERLRFGIDGGGGSLKICMSLQSVESELEPKMKKRRTFSDDTCPSQLFQDSGVKKLFIIGLVQNVQEGYENVKQLWSDIGIDELNGTTSADLKLCNIMSGVMPCSSTYPCCYCEVSKENLEGSSNLRTIKNIKENFAQWLNDGADKKSAKNFKCCVADPIFSCNENKSILDILPPPELHLYLGVINGLFNNMEKEFKGVALSWAQACNVERQVTYGFNGNDCKQLLKKLDVLSQACPKECQKYVKAYRDFKLVVDSCFSKDLNPEFTSNIDNFKKSYIALGISITPKVHCIFEHVKEFCLKHQVGLGLFSEQAFESVHHEFKLTWNKYLVKESHPNYAQKLLRAVCEFNSLHV